MKMVSLQECPEKKPLQTNKHMEACLRFVQQHVDKPDEFCENLLGTDASKIELYGHMNGPYSWRAPKTCSPTEKPGADSETWQM